MSIYLYVNLVAVYTIYEPALAIIIIATLFMNLTASLINFAKDGLFYHITSTPNDGKTQLCSITVSMMLLSGILYISIEMCSTIILPALYIKIQFLGIM